MRLLSTVMRCVLFACLGIALAVAGVQFFSIKGAAVWGILLLLALLDGYDGILIYRKGRLDGAKFAVYFMWLDGWRKS